jgi:5'-nucleotidase
MAIIKEEHRTLTILVSNDDGGHSPGIAALTTAMRQIAIVSVVAPDRNRSGASHSLTLDRPLRTQNIENSYPQNKGILAISVDGTPTDCVHLAIGGLMYDLPDLVISGINNGANLGDDVLYSGTIAAAMEGRFLGFPAIAVSLAGEKCTHYETAAIVTRKIVQLLRQKLLPSATILNVNVPDLPIDEIKGFEITRLGTRHRSEAIFKDQDPRGETIYWVGPAGEIDDATEGTDFWAIKHNKVSITPLHADLTNFQAFDSLSTWVKKLKI